jgi:hypothetical protein
MIHIDLLNPSEHRFQGPASGRFLLGAAAGTLLLLGALGAMHLLTSLDSLRQEWERSSAIWEELQPRQNRLQEVQKASQEMEKLINEAGEWASTRLDWSRILDHVQDVTSDTTQITRMEIRDHLEEPAAPADSKERPPPLRYFRMSLSGRIYGARGEEQVGMLISALRDFTMDDVPVFKTLELQTWQEDRSADAHSFVIVTRGTERVLE